MIETLDAWVTSQAGRRPEAVAVAADEVALTYGGLERRSGQVTRILREMGCRHGDRVGLLATRTPAAIAALIGVYKAGCIHVPLDPASPAARLGKILDACDTPWLLAGGPVDGLLDELAMTGRTPLRIGCIDDVPRDGRGFVPWFTAADVLALPPAAALPGRRSTDAAHILFTSGSTGTPKGVVITHANVIPFIEWAVGHFGIDPSDRLSGHPPLHFDLSVLDLFGAFAAGAQLHPVPAELNVLPNRIAEFIRRARLTQWFSVPSLLTYMAKFDVVRQGDFPDLRRVLWCGEAFPGPVLAYWMRRLPHVRFTNLYGPTETTIASSHYAVPGIPADERAPIPIGRACPGEELLVLDDRLEPVPPGGEGDLYIAGVGLSPGYWRDPEKTRQAFLPDPRGGGPDARIYRTGDRARLGEDGLVTFLGRADAQIKSRGYRIELGEIETALASIDGLREFAVVAAGVDRFEGALICCAYVPGADAGPTPVLLRRALAALLPGPMLPARWRVFERLPRNANGKIDRAVLSREFELDEAAASRQP